MVPSCMRVSLLASILLLAPWFSSRAEEARTALVIGNSHYAFAPLPNPEHDAADIADALRGAGFSVDLVLDACRDNPLGPTALSFRLVSSPAAASTGKR